MICLFSTLFDHRLSREMRKVCNGIVAFSLSYLSIAIMLVSPHINAFYSKVHFYCYHSLVIIHRLYRSIRIHRKNQTLRCIAYNNEQGSIALYGIAHCKGIGDALTYILLPLDAPRSRDDQCVVSGRVLYVDHVQMCRLSISNTCTRKLDTLPCYTCVFDL